MPDRSFFQGFVFNMFFIMSVHVFCMSRNSISASKSVFRNCVTCSKIYFITSKENTQKKAHTYNKKVGRVILLFLHRTTYHEVQIPNQSIHDFRASK